jgi:HEXXH motif-containing protein
VRRVDVEELIEDLGGGCASVQAVRALQHRQEAKRLLMLKMLLERAADGHQEQFARADFANAFEMLARLQADHPELIGRLLNYPSTGAWLGHSLRRLAAPAKSATPIWADLGYLGWLAAAALLQAGERGSSPIVIRDGHVMLPGMGLARVGPETASGLGEFLVTADGFEIRSPGSPGVVAHPHNESASWTPLPRVMIPDFGQEGIVLDAADPFLNAACTRSNRALFTAAVDGGYSSWPALLLDAADGLLDAACPAHRAPVAAWLHVVRPKQTPGPGHSASDTSPESFGSVATSTPRDAADLARTLVHEFQHAMLGALQDCVSLTEPSSGQQFYAPWVGAMRSAEMLLQGAYAHLGVVAFLRGYGRFPAGRFAQRTGEECDSLASEVSWALGHLRGSGVLTSQGTRFVDALRTVTASWPTPLADSPRRLRHRATELVRTNNPPTPLTARMLTAYLDACSEHGPLHAQITADLGSRLLLGTQFPPYQVVTPAGLRAGIAADCPALPSLADPRELPARQRSAPWNFLCAELDRWDRLDAAERLRAARVLARLGFWATLASLPIGHDPADRTLGGLRLAALHCGALHAVRGATPELGAEAFRIQRDIAANPDMPVGARLSAAVNATVMYGRSGSPAANVWERAEIAQRIVPQASRGELSDLLLSAYWRGISFAPLAGGNHRVVAEMLDESERLARQAVAAPATGQRLLAAENLHLVLETRGQAASLANDAQSAHGYLAELARRDPLDARPFVRLGNLFLVHEDFTRASHAYRRAALLGAPHTAYARELLAFAENRARVLRLRGGKPPSQRSPEARTIELSPFVSRAQAE